MASKQTSKANETGFLNSGNNKPCILKAIVYNAKRAGFLTKSYPFVLIFSSVPLL